MEREVEERYERMEALLRAGIERGNEMEKRFQERMEKADEKAERRYQEAMQRMDRSEQRMKVFDRRLEATRRLVEAGMKIVAGIGRRQRATEEALRELAVSHKDLKQTLHELAKSQKAFLDSLRRGGNGHGRLS